jgi:hypothetical protein
MNLFMPGANGINLPNISNPEFQQKFNQSQENAPDG